MSSPEFNHMVSTNARFLKSFAFNFTRNLQDAEDLLQDTLLKAMRYRENFEDGTNFKGWLYTIMRNIFINNYKRKKLHNTFTDTTPQQYYMNSRAGSDTVSQVMNEKAINAAISGLAYEYRTPFQMFMDGYHYDEISNAMAIPMGTVKSRIFHARKKLMTDLVAYA